MKIVISPDSFKGSLTTEQVAETMGRACLEVVPQANVVIKPMADGGEGTMDTLLFTTNGKRFQVTCSGPLGDNIETAYGKVEQTAFLEVASVAGLTQVPVEQRDPYKTTSYGLGECIKHVLDAGFASILIGLGGSATNDGGLGMLQALGAKFFDHQGNEVDKFGEDLLAIHRVDLSGLDSRLKNTTINIACDVDNPLCGPRGASAVYGPQKGATAVQIQALDEALHHYAELIEASIESVHKHVPGAGAAGGLGFAFMVLGGELASGAELIGNVIRLEEEISTADLVLTGEGQSDEQTLYGKAPGFVAKLANTHGVPAVLISGSVRDDQHALLEHFTGCFSITRGPATLEECMTLGEDLLYEQTVNVLHLIQSLR
ncbi:glycerate kinase [Bacillus fonticola]|uniref:glycerate kinase n=1 Tax=Bacillus fonticola TaxID=2728853 RepID=UPI001472E236|nr:glycerate kinase [Bacillus fonticola]